MSESKFTPGPWGIPDVGRKPVLVSAGDVFGWRGMIAHVDAGDYARSVSEGIANARLIAAAPDLYEALASLLQDVKEYVRVNNLADSDGKPASNDAMRRAEAALLKATPEQSE